jgi:hypothetical protein
MDKIQNKPNSSIKNAVDNTELCLVFTVAGGIPELRGGQEESFGAPSERE